MATRIRKFVTLSVILNLFWIQEAVPLDQQMSSSSGIRTSIPTPPSVTVKDQRSRRLDEIARQRMTVKTLQHFCTMDGLFCVPANYSK